MKSIVFIMLVSLALVSQAGSPNSAPASFACVLQADTLAKTKARAVERLAACDRDWIILDVAFDGETMWDRANLDTLRRGRSGRKVLAYMSIGEAEDYRAYWRKMTFWAALPRPYGSAPGARVEGQLPREILS